MGGSVVVGPCAAGRRAARGRWRAHHPPSRRARRRRGASRPAATDGRAARNRRTLRGYPAAGCARPGLRAAQAGREHHRPGSLCQRRHLDRKPSGLPAPRRARAPEHPDRGRDQQRQDHAGECLAGRDCRYGRSRAGARRHHRAAMRRPRPCTAAHPPASCR